MNINLASKGNGFGLFQNDSAARLSYNQFIGLIVFLKEVFPHKWDPCLFTDQQGYIFFASEAELRSKIKFFISRMNFEQTTNSRLGLYII